MKFKRRQIADDIQINLTPMIDCLLFILIFLLLSTSFNQYSRMNLTLPDAQGVASKAYEHKIEVVVDAKGQYTLNGQSLNSQHSQDLSHAMQQIAKQRRDLTLIIAADAKASHQDVIRVMDVAGQLGFVNINISTKVPARGDE